MREEYLLWTSLMNCEEFDTFEAAKKAANEKKGGCIEVLKVDGGGFIVDRYAVWSYKSGFINDPRK